MNPSKPLHRNHEERAFLARLAAMNVMFEAAKIGHSAYGYAQKARSCDELLVEFLKDLKAH